MEHSRLGDACVIRNDLDGPKILHTCFDYLLRVCFLADIAFYCYCFSPHCLDQAHYFIGGLLVAGIVDDHIGAFLRESERNCPAYTPSTTCYDCVLTV